MSRSFGITDPGLKRQTNQDTFYTSDEAGVWLVADGMGGRHGGEVASQIAQDTIVSGLKDSVESKNVILSAHRAILEHGEHNPEMKGLGTTVVLIKEVSAKVEISWVGDSRVYLWRNNKLSQLSKDHSVVQRLLDSGMINHQESINHPQRNLVTSVLGLVIENEADLEVGLVNFSWRNGDKLMLCSDGLTDELEDSKIEEIMQSNSESEQQANNLLQAALTEGGRDNTTVLIIEGPKTKNILQRLISWMVA
jgi:protein phosphatase